jgi:hypothetical protein
MTEESKAALVERLLDNLEAVSEDNQMLVTANGLVHIYVERKDSEVVAHFQLPFDQVIAVIQRLQRGQRTPDSMVLVIPTDAGVSADKLLAHVSAAALRVGFRLVIIPVQVTAAAVMTEWQTYMSYLPVPFEELTKTWSDHTTKQ